MSKTLSPSSSTTVGVVGSGYVSILSAKLAALRGYSTWLVHPPGEEDKILSLYGEKPSNLVLVPSSDTDALQSQLLKTSGVIIAVDTPELVMDSDVIKYLLDPETAPGIQRVVAMSRNLNGEGMGFFVKASKVSANSEVWSADGGTIAKYKTYEDDVKKACKALDAELTIFRAGTLKGGACGDENTYPQYLSSEYYTITKKDLITWQLLFDCKTRGIVLKKGDVMSGPGVKAVFTATSPDDCEGDTGRCGICDAMVRSLEVEGCGGVDLGVGTKEGREVPTEEEWAELWKF